jgi:hypothetical protein
MWNFDSHTPKEKNGEKNSVYFWGFLMWLMNICNKKLSMIFKQLMGKTYILIYVNV